MKNTLGLLSTIAVIGGLMMAFMSCEVAQTITNSYDVYGKAVLVKTPVGDNYYSALSGSSVTLTGISGTSGSYSTSVDGSGNFYLNGVSGGKYSMTGSSGGYTFIPQIITVYGANTFLPYLMAFPTSGADALTVVMTWEDTSVDMDLSMATGTNTGATNTYQIDSANKTRSRGNTGGSDSFWTATLDRDITGSYLNTQPLVETITISDTSGGGGMNGNFRVYVSSVTSSATTGDVPTVQPAGVTVHVFQGANHLGTYFAPYNTAETILRICSIAVANSNFTVYTDIQSATSVKSLLTGIPTVGKVVSSFF